VSKHLGKWLPQVKHNREADFLDFTTRDVVGEGVRLNSLGQIADNLRGKTASKLEQAVQAELQRQGLRSELDLKRQEELGGGLTGEQLEERYQQVAQMKQLLFRQEHKHRRIAKIKSKLYHKIKKREKEREEKKLLDYLEQVDPAAAAVYREKEEQRKVEERLRQRHATNNKFAKKLKRFGMMEHDNLRQSYDEMMREKNALKQRTKGRNTNESDEDDSDNEDLSESELKKKAIENIEAELNESSKSNSDDSEDSVVDFSEQ